MSGTATTQAEQAVREAAASLDVDALAIDVSAVLMRDVFAGRRADPGFSTLVEESTHGNLSNIREVFGGRVRVAATRATPGALELAATAAELRLPEAALERAYRAGQNRFWASWFRTAREHAATSGQDLGAYLEQPSEQLFDYIEHVLGDVGARYQSVAALRAGGHERLRDAVLGRIVGGEEDVDDGEIERALGYAPAAHHAFVVLRLDAAACPEALVDHLRRAAGAVGALVHREGVGDWGLWLALPDAIDGASGGPASGDGGSGEGSNSGGGGGGGF